MNAEETDNIRNKLLRLQSELQALEETSKETSEPVELDQARIGRLSRMDAMQTQQMALEASRRRQHQLLKIEGALRRLETGVYGYCFVCGKALDARRLSVDPTNTRCMPCAEK